jgi:hypothetical protein
MLQEARLFRYVLSLFGIKRQTITLDIAISTYYTNASRSKTVLMYIMLTINILDKNAIIVQNKYKGY